jgi:hypothetical protein
MTDEPELQNEVRILPPDQTLKKKLGGANLDQLLSVNAVKTAQKVIVNSSDAFLEESLEELKQLEQAVSALGDSPEAIKKTREKIISTAFALTAKAGLGGYDLASTIAKSLHTRCVKWGEQSLAPANVDVIKWHIESLKQLFSRP